MNYHNDNEVVVSNDEIINLINDKLLKIQNQLFNKGINGDHAKFLKILKSIKSILTILIIAFCLIAVFNFKIIYIICAVLGIIAILVISAVINRSLENKKSMEQSINQNNKEAVILQDTRSFLHGKIPSNDEITTVLSELSKEIINMRNSIK